ncbi:ThuA domain-containing protein [Neobacillus niacini]|uniref:ThuA domain-containing protein n=1 Tax=Neobacillus niacini TaxID=86668 RepID=UPI002042247D|nr:ThuA domain-containing protein [Neobacillus niacini]MCM3690435.1 ThuA domain-containing protein [Neobacillus niacini]
MIRLAAVLGDYYHSSEWAKQSLETALSFGKEDLQIDYCTSEQLPEILEKQPDVVIHFKENRVNPANEIVETWLTQEVTSKITNYVENGGSWLAWHSGLASFPVEGAYIKMLKGYFLYHPQKHHLVHYKAIGGNSVLPSTTSFEIVDEHYFVHCDSENTNVFLFSESIDGQSPAGWCHSFGAGKVCCLTPAHNKEGLLNEGFLETLRKCVNWLILR